MEAPTRKKIRVEEFLMKVLMELPVPSASEMDQAQLMERHLGLQKSLEDEIMALRWWYLSHLLYGQLVHRARVHVDLALAVIALFVELRDQVVSQMPVDFSTRCEFYERALQDDLDDEGHGFQLLGCFNKFVGSDNEALKEIFYASMVGVTSRLARALDRFEIVQG
jgi:hypothetical protein